MYFHFLCSYNRSRQCICVHGFEDVHKEEFVNLDYRDQPLDRYIIRVQNKINNVNIRRTKQVIIELKGVDLAEYFDGENYLFNGKKLLTTQERLKKIGVIKRKRTIQTKAIAAINGTSEIDKLKALLKPN
jgi:hypothetical protein